MQSLARVEMSGRPRRAAPPRPFSGCLRGADGAHLRFCPETRGAAPQGWRVSRGRGTVGAWSGQDPAGSSRARVHGGEPAGLGPRHRWGTAPGGLFGCPERRSGSHQPFLLVCPLVQDRNRRSPEVPSSRTCTRPSASSSPLSTTRQVCVLLRHLGQPAASS